MSIFYKICILLLIVGGLNWGLVGLFRFRSGGLAVRRFRQCAQPHRLLAGRPFRSGRHSQPVHVVRQRALTPHSTKSPLPSVWGKAHFVMEKEKIVHQHLILGLLVCHGLAGHDHRLRAGKPSCVHDNHSCFLLNAFLRKVFTQAMTATPAMPMIFRRSRHLTGRGAAHLHDGGFHRRGGRVFGRS